MKLNMAELVNLKPYSYKYKPGFLFYNGFYEIYYDDTRIEIVGNSKDAKAMVCLLNAAFLEGVLHAELYTELDKGNQ